MVLGCLHSQAGGSGKGEVAEPGEHLPGRTLRWVVWNSIWELAPKGDGCKGFWDSETVQCHTRLDFSSQIQIIWDFHNFFVHEHQLMLAASELQCSASSRELPHCCRPGLSPSVSCTKAGKPRDPSPGVKPSFKGILSLSTWPENFQEGTASEKLKTWETKDALCTASACATSLISNPCHCKPFGVTVRHLGP